MKSETRSRTSLKVKLEETMNGDKCGETKSKQNMTLIMVLFILVYEGNSIHSSVQDGLILNY